jgi:hypothetical protein
MKKFFKKLWLKIFIKLNKKIRPAVDIDENERISSSICRKLINDENSKFLIAPLSQKRYIKNEVTQMFVVIHHNRINITNHVYNYDIIISTQMSEKLNRIFDNKVEEERIKFEKEMYSQIKHSLKKILEKLT